MKKVLLFILNLLFASVVYSQVNPEPGFIITNDNDTIYGTLDFRTEEINAKKCSFKADGKEVFVAYAPNDIIGYRFTNNGKFYVSKTFVYENNVYNVFAEYMVKGTLNVYRVNGIETDVVYFFENEKNEVASYRNFSDTSLFDKDIIRKNSQQLFSFLSKSSINASNEVQVSNMSSKQVINLAQIYHEDVCTSNEDCIKYEYDTKNDVVGDRFYVGVGFIHFWESKYYLAQTIKPVYTIGVMRDMRRFCQNMSLYAQADIYIHDRADFWYSFKFGTQFKIGADNKPKFTYKLGISMPCLSAIGFSAGIGAEVPVFKKSALFVNVDITSPCLDITNFMKPEARDTPYMTHLTGTAGFRF